MAKRKSISPKLRFSVLERDGFMCRYCGRSPPDVILHCDHIVPVCEGGQNTIDNIVSACEPCNLGKGARTMRARPSGGRASEERSVDADVGENRMVGLGVLTFLDGEPNFQGEIVGFARGGVALVQCFSWFTGDECGSPKRIPVANLLSGQWENQSVKLFASNSDRNEWYSANFEGDDDRDWNSRMWDDRMERRA